MRRVVATGTFDILHPGHLWYLEKSAELGDELFVIVARDRNVKHKPRPLIPEQQRLTMIQALKPVTKAVLGDQEDMFRPIREIRPDVITLGFNQHFDETQLKAALASQGINAGVIRIGEYTGSPFTSSSSICEAILRERSLPGT